MTLYQFKLLGESEQIDAIWDSPLLAIIEDDEFTYELHQLGPFYAEVKYRKPNRTISAIKTFKKPGLLKPYLDQMNTKS